MGTELTDNISKDAEPFITFDAEGGAGQIISYVGYEFICTNPKCDCQSISIGVSTVGGKYILTYINYGWRNYEYYINYGHSEDYARELTQGRVDKKGAATEQDRLILLGFRRWLIKNKALNDRLIADRYKDVKLAVINRQKYKERNTKLNKLFNLMLELFGEEKVKEFIANCGEQIKISHSSNYKKSR